MKVVNQIVAFLEPWKQTKNLFHSIQANKIITF